MSPAQWVLPLSTALFTVLTNHSVNFHISKKGNFGLGEFDFVLRRNLHAGWVRLVCLSSVRGITKLYPSWWKNKFKLSALSKLYLVYISLDFPSDDLIVWFRLTTLSTPGFVGKKLKTKYPFKPFCDIDTNHCIISHIMYVLLKYSISKVTALSSQTLNLYLYHRLLLEQPNFSPL